MFGIFLALRYTTPGAAKRRQGPSLSLMSLTSSSLSQMNA